MPSTSLQSRINAFESLAGSSPSKSVKESKSPTRILETPIAPAAASLPIVPYSLPKVPSRSPSPSPPNLGRKTSLIDLKDWIVDDGPLKHNLNGLATYRTNGKPRVIDDVTRTPTCRAVQFDGTKTTNGHTFVSPPLINLESPPKPPLPPRKGYHNSPESTPGATKSIATRNASSTSLPPPKRADSLTVEHTYPPLSKLNVSDASRKSPGHAPTSSISSFHSVSLSSDGGQTDPSTPGSVSNFISTFPMDQDGSEVDTVSLDDSYENVSITSIASPTTAERLALNWEKAMAQRGPPKLPQRPPSKSSTTVSSPTSLSRSTYSSPPPSSQSTAIRRVPPPPPSRSASSRTSLISNTASDRSSIISTSTTTTSLTSYSQPTNQSISHRPTLVPAAARKRYEVVFVANVLKNQKQKISKPSLSSVKKSRQAAGWRGLSVDLITNSGEHLLDNANAKATSEEKMERDGGEVVGTDERLDGSIVKLIWSTSRLDKGKLRDIWNECDIASLGSLDRDSFVRGMWRIDEELRRAHAKTCSASSSTTPLVSYSFRSRQPPKMLNTKLILR